MRRSLLLLSASLVVALFCAPGFARQAAQRPGPTPLRQVAQPALPEGAASDWWSKAQAGIQKEEYSVTWQEQTALQGVGAAWQAPNRAHGFRTYFTEDGIRVVPRTEQEDAWELGLSLVRSGRAGNLQPVARPVVSARHNTADYHRGGISEWYINDGRGLEQSFRIAAPPDGTGRLALEMALSGSLHPAFSVDKQAVTFYAPGR